MKKLVIFLLTVVSAHAALGVTTTALPPAYIGIATSGTLWTLTASGGTAPYTWSISSGTMPAGLQLNSNGTITGTATTSLTPVTTYVTTSQTYTSTTLAVNSSSGFTFPAIVRLGSELEYCAASFSSCVRGYEGTPVASHNYSTNSVRGELVSTAGISTVVFQVTDNVSTTATKALAVWSLRRQGLGCTTLYTIDRDCDYYGIGSPIGLDADDTDATVTTQASFVTRWGSGNALTAIQAFYASSTKNYGSPLHWVFIDGTNGSSSCDLGQSPDAATTNFTHPCQTFAQAKSRTSAGDAVIWRAGTYIPAGADTCGYALHCTVSGTASHYSIFAGYPGEQVVQSRNVAGYHVFGMVNGAGTPCSYWAIDNMIINDYLTAPTGAGIAMQGTVNSSYSLITNVEVIGFYDQTFLMSGYQYMTISYSSFHDTSAGSEHNMYMQAFNFESTGLLITGCLIYHASAAGNNLHINGQFTSMTLSNNIIYASNSDNINFEQGVQYALVENNILMGATNSAIGLVAYWQNSMCPAGGYATAVIRGMNHNTFRNNTIYHDGNDWGAGGGSSCGNAMFRVIDSTATGNPCINSTNATFDHGHNTFDNNIFITGSNCSGTGYAVEYSKDYNGGGGMTWLASDTWRNNIFFVEGSGNWSTHFLLGRKVTDWSTDYTKTWAEYLAGAYSSSNTVNVDPQVYATSPNWYDKPTMFNFLLQAGSPALNAAYVSDAPAADITGASRGSSPSIGAFQSNTGVGGLGGTVSAGALKRAGAVKVQ